MGAFFFSTGYARRQWLSNGLELRWSSVHHVACWFDWTVFPGESVLDKYKLMIALG